MITRTKPRWFYGVCIFITGIVLSLMNQGCALSSNPYFHQARNFQKGKLTEDTSFVYRLPYHPGARHRLIQGYYSRGTHKYRAALDFGMKKGTPVLAARDGVVERIKDDSNRGGMYKRYRPHANYVTILHEDGTRASYRHLAFQSVRVQPGDQVETGQVLGLCGKTGYTFTAHLHFMVSTLVKGEWRQIPTRFKTTHGVTYLKPYKRYRATEPETQETLSGDH